MIITPKMNFVSGSFDTAKCEMVCVSKWKYRSVDLCIRCDTGSMSIPMAEIKLYDSDRWGDADKTFEDAKAFGEEIAHRWNEFNDKK